MTIRLSVIGAGALGRTYGVHLAEAGHDVQFVVRPGRLGDTAPFVLQQKNGRRARHVGSAPRVTRVSRETSCVLLAVRADQVDESLRDLLRAAPPVPVVALTPLFPHLLAQLEGWLQAPCLVAMPTVAAELGDDGVVQFWSFRSTPTLIERGDEEMAALAEELVGALRRSGLPAKLSDDVRTRNPATTIAFFPISVAVSLAGGVEALRRDPALAALGARAAREGLALGRRIGPIDLPAQLLLRTLTGSTLRGGFLLARAVAPAVVSFVDAHFGNKLCGQHRVLGSEALVLAREYGVPTPALAELLARSGIGV